MAYSFVVLLAFISYLSSWVVVVRISLLIIYEFNHSCVFWWLRSFITFEGSFRKFLAPPRMKFPGMIRPLIFIITYQMGLFCKQDPYINAYKYWLYIHVSFIAYTIECQRRRRSFSSLWCRCRNIHAQWTNPYISYWTRGCFQRFLLL